MANSSSKYMSCVVTKTGWLKMLRIIIDLYCENKKHTKGLSEEKFGRF
jgi:hypothetical protein